MARLMVLFLCLAILSPVTGSYVEPKPYGTPSDGVGAYQAEPSGGRTDDQTWQYWQQKCWWEQKRVFHPWEPQYCGYSDVGGE